MFALSRLQPVLHRHNSRVESPFFTRRSGRFIHLHENTEEKQRHMITEILEINSTFINCK